MQLFMVIFLLENSSTVIFFFTSTAWKLIGKVLECKIKSFYKLFWLKEQNPNAFVLIASNFLRKF